MNRHLVGPWQVAVVTALSFFCDNSSALAAPPAIEHIDAALDDLDVPRAEQLAKGLDPGDPRGEFRLALIAFHQANYEAAAARLQTLITNNALSGRELDHAREILRMTNGALATFKQSQRAESSDGHFVAVFAQAKDAVLAPYLFATLQAAERALAQPLGVRPLPPLRFEILADPADLAQITTLPIDAVYTTGTVGITKFNRIMMVTPRVLLHGYGWLDTACHEFVHQLVTLRTGNNAPVWLQEGLAKLFENRWRGGDPWQLEGGQTRLLRDALAQNDLVTLEEMHPSIALLPTQQRASLAYAEVQTMLALLESERGPTGLKRLLDEVAAGKDAKSALASAWGASFADFDQRWRAELRKRTAKDDGRQLRERQFVDAEPSTVPDNELAGDLFSALAGGKARQHARLGALLQLGGHADAARIEYEKATKADPKALRDPVLTRRLGELTLENGDPKRAAELLSVALRGAPDSATLAHALAQALYLSGKPDKAREAIAIAVQNNPFVPGLHCTLAKLTSDPALKAHEQKACEATRAPTPSRPRR